MSSYPEQVMDLIDRLELTSWGTGEINPSAATVNAIKALTMKELGIDRMDFCEVTPEGYHKPVPPVEVCMHRERVHHDR